MTEFSIDFFDYESDRVNRTDRAIISGDVTRIQALYISIFSFLAGVFLSLKLNFNSQILSSDLMTCCLSNQHVSLAIDNSGKVLFSEIKVKFLDIVFHS